MVDEQRVRISGRTAQLAIQPSLKKMCSDERDRFTDSLAFLAAVSSEYRGKFIGARDMHSVHF